MSKTRVVLNHSINTGKMNRGDTVELPEREAKELIKVGSATKIKQSKVFAVSIDFKQLKG
jgi:hypothetical protein